MEVLYLFITVILTITLSCLVGWVGAKKGDVKSPCLFLILIMMGSLASIAVFSWSPTIKQTWQETKTSYHGAPILVKDHSPVNRVFKPLSIVYIGTTPLFYESDGKFYDFTGIKYENGITRETLETDPERTSYIVFDKGGQLYLGRNITNNTNSASK